MRIWAHTLVRNEERYLWFAVNSVIDYVDKILLWDTGSTDDTGKIIREIKKRYKDKISFRQVGLVDQDKFTQVRQEMLEETSSDWMIIVDGDEVWWDGKIKYITDFIYEKGNNFETIVQRYFNIVGDIFHYQEEKAGKYKIDNKVGHLQIRAFNRHIPGLYFDKPHGQQGIFDENDRLIQERSKEKRFFIDDHLYMHFTNMLRSKSLEEDLKVMKRDIKIKYEMGLSFPLDFYYPEVFFKERPEFLSSPWKPRSTDYTLKATIQTPLKVIKRRIYSGPSGY